MPLRIVQSKQNPRLKELRKALAHPGPNERGLVGIEGPHLIAEALRAGLHFASLFVAQGSERLLEPLTLPEQIEVLAMPKELLDSALATESPQLMAGLVVPPDWTWAHVLPTAQKSPALLVILAGIQDPGNLGTIIRSAEAFGADGVVCLPGTVNAWNPKAARASAGSVFRLPVLNVREHEALEQLHEAGVRVLATTVHGAQPADLVDLTGAVALIIGNEGNGVPANLALKADGAVTIPCPGQVESLNAAVAASVLLYESARQRSLKTGASPEMRGGVR